MIFTDRKTETLRTATATGRIRVGAEALSALRGRRVSKGDVLEVARTAGILAAKRTSEIIPHCHPIPLDGIFVDFTVDEGGIDVTATAKAIWKTGVEMEALTAAGVAMLTVFDMLKSLDTGMEIGEIRVASKTGGKTDFTASAPKNLKAAVLVASDGVYDGKREDLSGVRIEERLRNFGIQAVERVVLPDDKEKIQKKILELCEKGYRLIFTTGGTGLGPRDVTVEATQEILERPIPGIAEAMRDHGQRRTPYSMLSRGVAGLRGDALIVNLPGSPGGVEESLDAVFPAILHVFHALEGRRH